MEQNVGGMDRTARLIAGPLLVLVGAGALLEAVPGGMAVGAVALLLGAVFTVTGLTRMCILNKVLGIDTSGR